MGIKLGIILTTGDPRTAAELAALADEHGWDGVFTWDGIALGSMDTFDPWVVMAAMAMRTERVRLGAIVTPPRRRRPWKLARETMSLDRLSNGRLILPLGLGALDDGAFANVGEPTETRIRAELLDESLAILDGLWSGEPFAFSGRHYRFDEMTFRPTPVQRPADPDLGRRCVAPREVAPTDAGLGRDPAPGRGRGEPPRGRRLGRARVAGSDPRSAVGRHRRGRDSCRGPRRRPGNGRRARGGRRDVVDRVRLGVRHRGLAPAPDRGRPTATRGVGPARRRREEYARPR